MTEVCPECNSKEIKVKHGFIFCHDCGHVIGTYNRIEKVNTTEAMEKRLMRGDY